MHPTNDLSIFFKNATTPVLNLATAQLHARGARAQPTRVPAMQTPTLSGAASDRVLRRRVVATGSSRNKVGLAVKILAALGLAGGAGVGGSALIANHSSEDKPEDKPEATPAPSPAATPAKPDEKDPVMYGAGGAALAGASSAAWGKMSGQPDLARDLIFALGGGAIGAGYAASANNNNA